MKRDYYTAEDYIANPDLFVPVWAEERGSQVPAGMLDFEEKWEQFFTPNGRLMCSAHRGDHVYYPECSTEGFLSAILFGADLLEVDVHLTKDNVAIVMHDRTLDRTTNVNELRESGVEGLPEYNFIADWTFEQIRMLRLVKDGEVTNSVVPSLEDIIILANNRAFITLDKFNCFLWHRDILPLIKKHNAYRTVMMPYAYTFDFPYSRVKEFMDEIKELSGYQSALMTRSLNIADVDRVAAEMVEYGFPMVLRCGEYNHEEHEAYTPYYGKYRIHIECLRAWNDTLDVWKQIIADGFNLIVTNDMMGMSKLIEENHFK